MLVLSRKVGERLVVPHMELAVTILEMKGNTVRLGISAPEDIAVYREEIWLRVCQQAPVSKMTKGKTKMKALLTDGEP